MQPLLVTTPEADHGLICAFALAPTEAMGIEALAHRDPDRPLWVHLNLTPTRAEHWLREEAPISEEAREEMTETEPRIHVRIFADGLVAVLGDLAHDMPDDGDDFGTLRIFLDDRRILTARRHPLQTADVVRKELRSGAEVESSIALFELFVEELAQTFGKVVTRLADTVDDAEDRILGGRFEDQGTVLGRVRRVLARVRRYLNANRSALGPVPTRLPANFPSDHKHSLHQAIERLDAVAQDLELVQERTRLLLEEIAARVGELTNRNLFWLSVVTTVLLPATLVTGIFGMNVQGLPFAEHPAGFWWVMGVIMATVILVLFVLRRRRLL